MLTMKENGVAKVDSKEITLLMAKDVMVELFLGVATVVKAMRK